MKFTISILLSIITLIGCSGEDSLSDSISMNPGTLGAVAGHELNCSEYNLGSDLDRLLEIDQFKPSIQDTNIVDWWKRNQYDFLNYKCIKIKKELYMITIFSENSSSTNISVRSFYSRSKKEWIFATEFNSIEEYNAENAMEYLMKNLPSCK